MTTQEKLIKIQEKLMKSQEKIMKIQDKIMKIQEKNHENPRGMFKFTEMHIVQKYHKLSL